MKRVAAVAAAAVLAVLALTGCSPISVGTVTGKEYSPAYVTTSLSCTYYGKNGCQMWMPQTHYWPVTYRLDLRNGDETGWVNVDQDTYYREKVGEWWGG